jgi:hypothetical protein
VALAGRLIAGSVVHQLDLIWCTGIQCTARAAAQNAQ